MTDRAPRAAVIAGATGLVGRHCLQRLLDDDRYARVTALARREPPLRHHKLHWLVTDFSDLAARQRDLAADDAYCCLGTTRRRAGSRAAFERVDYHMVLDFARAAHAAGARRLMLVSAYGADAAAPAFYARVKARTEQAVGDIGFDSVHILRPSLLLGAREERRPLEALGQSLAPLLSPLLRGGLAPMRPVSADAVAAALIAAAFSAAGGVQVHQGPFLRTTA